MDNWNDVPLVMNTEQCARVLGVHPNTVKNLLKKNAIPARRVGRNWKFDREAIREWLRGDE